MATLVVAVINQKGGAGKTTLAMNLAVGLAQRGETLLLDLDPQASCIQWASHGNAPFPVPVKQIHKRWDGVSLRRDYRAYPHLVLDCPPSLDHPAFAQALRACDVALIPVLPSPIDLWASVRLPQEIAEARKTNPRLRAHLVLNQLEPKSALSGAMRDALAEFGVPVLASDIRRRSVYRTSALEGVSVYQLGRRGAPAVAEIEALINEIHSS